jgi:hypothetical protein
MLQEGHDVSGQVSLGSHLPNRLVRLVEAASLEQRESEDGKQLGQPELR